MPKFSLRAYVKILRDACLGAFAGLAVSVVSVSASETVLKLSTDLPAGDLLVNALQDFADSVKEGTDGKVVIEVYPGNTLYKVGTETTALQRGVLDIATLNTGPIAEQLPEFGIFGAGYVFRDYDHFEKVFDGNIGEEFGAALSRTLGVRLLGTFYVGARHVILRSEKNVEVPGDLAGMKLRAGAAPTWIALGKGLGGAPTPMAIPEVYLALRTGAIDGLEQPLGPAKGWKLEEVSKQILLTGHMLQPIFLAVSERSWDRLTSEQQLIISDAARNSIQIQNRARQSQEEEELTYFKQAGLRISNVNIDSFRNSVRQAFDEAGLSSDWKEGLAAAIDSVK